MAKFDKDKTKFRKLIDIPEEIRTDLKVLAAKADMDLKTFIEDVLIKLVNKSNKG